MCSTIDQLFPKREDKIKGIPSAKIHEAFLSHQDFFLKKINGRRLDTCLF